MDESSIYLDDKKAVTSSFPFQQEPKTEIKSKEKRKAKKSREIPTAAYFEDEEEIKVESRELYPDYSTDIDNTLFSKFDQTHPVSILKQSSTNFNPHRLSLEDM